MVPIVRTSSNGRQYAIFLSCDGRNYTWTVTSQTNAVLCSGITDDLNWAIYCADSYLFTTFGI